MKKLILLITLIASVIAPNITMAQNGTIKGRIFNEKNNEPLAFANIIIDGTNIGSTSDFDGNFVFTGIQPGYVKLTAISLGFERRTTEEFLVTNARSANVNIPMKEIGIQLETVEVQADAFKKFVESPVSVRTLGVAELERSPGGNRDVSRVIQALPGVASGVSFRNDVIVRGGGSSENKFFLDDVEIPNLNHFATQGASGGPVGIINIDFIREIDFYSSAFPVNRGNALSSVLNMRQIEGNKDRMRFKGAIGASDLALTTDGPIGSKTNYLLSYRRSYLQFLFGVIGLPFLPTYNDYQFKLTHKIDDKNQINIISIGALDQFSLNTGLKDPSEYQQYILGYLPVNEQWNYTFGVVYKHFSKNGYQNWVLSRNFLNNVQYKYPNNDNSQARILDYVSSEIENKFRFEDIRNINGFRLTSGLGGEYAKYFNETSQRLFIGNTERLINYNSFLEVYKWNAFAQITKTYFNKLTLSAGLRSDANNYNAHMSNLLNQLSPRVSSSYSLNKNTSLNASLARYYQLPAYTTLGFRDEFGKLVNKENNLKYVRADHAVVGIEHFLDRNTKISAETFYKWYANYPFSIRDSISLASKGADFGVVGDEAVSSTSKGRAFGFELFAQRKMSKKIDFTLSYTFVRSEFTGKDNKYIASAWDNVHLFNAILSRSFAKNWDIGFKWRFSGGAPYTPDDLLNSSYVNVWNVNSRALPNNARYNDVRLKSFHQLDMRIDKAYYLKKFTMMFYLDIQNLYAFVADTPPIYILDRDANGQAIIENPTAPIQDQKYRLKKLEGDIGASVLPTIGLIIEF
jgi:hypothetical protein